MRIRQSTGSIGICVNCGGKAICGGILKLCKYRVDGIAADKDYRIFVVISIGSDNDLLKKTFAF